MFSQFKFLIYKLHENNLILLEDFSLFLYKIKLNNFFKKIKNKNCKICQYLNASGRKELLHSVTDRYTSMPIIHSIIFL